MTIKLRKASNTASISMKGRCKTGFGRIRWIKNRVGVYIRANENYVFHNQIADGERGVYLTTEGASNQIANNEVTGNKVGMYLKTTPNQFLANNFPTSRSNTENIRFTDDRSPAAANTTNIFGVFGGLMPWLADLGQ